MIAAADLVPIADARFALRVDETGADFDSEIGRCIAGAVEWAERFLGWPLADRAREEMAARPADADSPVYLASRYLKSVTGIAYWQPTQALREEPAGSVEISELGRIAKGDDATAVYPPAGGWPEILSDSAFRFRYVEGWDSVADIPHLAAIRRAVLTVASGRYEGVANWRHEAAASVILEPFADGRSKSAGEQ